MFLMDISSLLNIIALGGVATGSIKAQEHDNVPGIISNSGFNLTATAKVANIGRMIPVVAVLEVNSVRNVMMKQIAATMRMG